MRVSRLKEGATAHLKSTPYWTSEYNQISTLDGLVGRVVADYTSIEEYPRFAEILTASGIAHTQVI